MDKVLTVSIAAYNVSKYIGKTLSSIASCENAEKMQVIVVNDGSSDKTLDIVNHYVKQYPNIIEIIDKENGGYGSTINYSIKRAKGKYLKLLDGDDRFFTNNVKEFIEYLESIESDLILSPFLTDNHEKNMLIDNHSCSAALTDIKSICLTSDIVMHEIAVKRSIYKLFPEISQKCFYTDNEFCFYSLCYAKTVSKYTNPIYIYRIGNDEQSTSIKSVQKHCYDTVIVAKKLCREYEELDFDSDKPNTALVTKLRVVINNMYIAFLLRSDFRCAQKELKIIDQELKYKYPKSYSVSMSEMKIKLLRMSSFNGFRLCHLFVMNNMKRAIGH